MMCERLNRRSRMAQHASRASTDLHTALFFSVGTY
jgi:exoribonuclease R